MHWNRSISRECGARIDIQPIVHVDDFPKLFGFAAGTTMHLKGDHDQPHSSQQGQDMWLDGADEAAVMPVHQVPLFDCFHKIHREIVRL